MMAESTDGGGGTTIKYQNSGLFHKLPAEIRNQIYELVLIEIDSDGFEVFPWSEPSAKQPALTRCCSAIRKETLEIFYSKNSFQLWVLNEHNREIARSWLQAIGAKNRKCLEHLYVKAAPGWNHGTDVAFPWIPWLHPSPFQDFMEIGGVLFVRATIQESVEDLFSGLSVS